MRRKTIESNATSHNGMQYPKKPFLFPILPIVLLITFIVQDVILLPVITRNFPYLTFRAWFDLVATAFDYAFIIGFMLLFRKLNPDSLKVQQLKQKLKENFIKALDDSSLNPEHPAGRTHV